MVTKILGKLSEAHRDYIKSRLTNSEDLNSLLKGYSVLYPLDGGHVQLQLIVEFHIPKK